ncbi:unnamed protein product, partial [Pylaiella littoralis]
TPVELSCTILAATVNGLDVFRATQSQTDRQADGNGQADGRQTQQAGKQENEEKNSSRLRPMTLLSKGAAQRGIRRGGGGGSSSASSAAGAARKTTPRRQHTKQKVASARSSPRLHLTQKRTPDGRGR